MKNQEIAKILSEIGEYLEMKEEPFKPRAYAKAAEAISSMDQDIEKIYESGGMAAVEEIPGVGKSIAEKIEEFLKTGRIKYFEELKKKVPVDVSGLTAIEGLGPKKIKKLFKELDIRTVEDLEAAALSHKVRSIPGFGEKTEEGILKGIQFLKESGNRFILGFTESQIEEIRSRIGEYKGVRKAEIAGSARRKKETIGDLDILAITDHDETAKGLMKFFVSMPEVIHVYSQGETRSSVRLESGMDVDLRILDKGSYGAGLMYFTGSKDHNIELRKIAIRKGWKLNEYGLFDISGGKEKLIAGETEEEIYEKLGLQYIYPEIRENTGEIEAAGEDRLPKLIGYDDIMGDLQVQTEWTDGEDSIESCAMEAIKEGLKYILITDHSKRLTVANGLDEERLILQGREIDKLNKRLADQGYDFRILKGIECDIMKDGSMDLSDDALAQLDIVGASVHSYFNLPATDQVERIIRAMENRNVDVIFHPTARIINQRKAIDMDIDVLIAAALKTGTTLEIDAFPDRSDLKDEYIRKCVESGVKLSIDSDAHSKRHMRYIKAGIAQARRGWVERHNIVNAWPVKKCLELIKKD